MYEINAMNFFDKKEFHQYLKKLFNLPEFYGNNLDSLWDLLSERKNLLIKIYNKESFEKNLEGYGTKIIKLFEELNHQTKNKVEFLSSENIKRFNNFMPKIGKNVFVDESAKVIGDVELEENSSIWYNATLRADENKIRIGKNSNVQDNAVIHMSHNSNSYIGENVTIGHSAIIHGSLIEDNVIIGMGAIILDGAKISKNSIVGAGSLVTKNKFYPENSLIMGSPAKFVRELTEEEIDSIQENANNYVKMANEHRKSGL